MLRGVSNWCAFGIVGIIWRIWPRATPGDCCSGSWCRCWWATCSSRFTAWWIWWSSADLWGRTPWRRSARRVLWISCSSRCATAWPAAWAYWSPRPLARTSPPPSSGWSPTPFTSWSLPDWSWVRWASVFQERCWGCWGRPKTSSISPSSICAWCARAW